MMKKRYVIEVAILLIALVLPFINSDNKVNIDTLKNSAEQYIDTTVMETKDTKAIRKTHKMLEQEYTEYFSYGAISYMDVEEVTVFKQPDKEKRATIVTKVNTYITNKIAAFKGYGTTQTELLEEAIIVEKGDCIICIVTNNKELKERILECF